MPSVVGTHLETALAAHRARWGFAPQVREAGGRVRLDGPDGSRLAVQDAEGRWIAVHSAGDPRQDAEAWVAGAGLAADAPAVCVIGAGLGYVVDVLEARQPSTATILLLEPNAAVLGACLARRDWSALVAQGRLMCLSGPAFEGRIAAWRMVNAIDAPDVLVHPVLSRLWPDVTTAAAQVVGQAIAGARANAQARKQFAAPYLLNTLRNLPRLTRAHDVRVLAGRHAGQPAIVAAAGPSLNRNLETLARHTGWRDQAVVVAVDTALKPMLAAAMTPHYVVGVDPSAKNARTLTALPPVPDTALVAEASLDPRSFDAFEDRTYLFTVSSSHQPWAWLAQHGIGVGSLRAWGSVLTTAYDLAVTLGCDPVVFIGSDLAYTGGQPYCRGTIYEEDWARAVAGGRTLEEVWRLHLPTAELTEPEDLHGRATRSSATLVAFRDWLVAQAGAASGRRVINATGAGILAGPGVQQQPLDVVLASWPATAQVVVPPPASFEPIATAAALDQAVAALLGAVTAKPPAPLGDWLDFAAGAVNVAAIASAVSHGFPQVLRDHPRLGTALALRAESTASEAAAWRDLQAAPDAAAPADAAIHWRPPSPGDWCLGPTLAVEAPAGPRAAFHSYHALHLNARRMEHLASLPLALRERRVLDVGAGIGDLSEFFLDRGCLVRATEARVDHLDALSRRFATHPLASIEPLNLDPPPSGLPELFDVVFCYGVLYHLSDPAAALTYLARSCSDLLLVDTAVGADDAEGVNPVNEDPGLPGSAISGRGSRPARTWVWARLREHFAHVYVPHTQPNHYEYPLDWTAPSPFLRRAIFVASRRPLDGAAFSATLPARQQRH